MGPSPNNACTLSPDPSLPPHNFESKVMCMPPSYLSEHGSPLHAPKPSQRAPLNFGIETHKSGWKLIAKFIPGLRGRAGEIKGTSRWGLWVSGLGRGTRQWRVGTRDRVWEAGGRSAPDHLQVDRLSASCNMKARQTVARHGDRGRRGFSLAPDMGHL